MVINTNMDINNTYQPNMPTTVHFFSGIGATRWGGHIKDTSLDSKRIHAFEGTYGASNEDNSIYRIISSQSQNIISQGSACYGAPRVSRGVQRFRGDRGQPGEREVDLRFPDRRRITTALFMPAARNGRTA